MDDLAATAKLLESAGQAGAKPPRPRGKNKGSK